MLLILQRQNLVAAVGLEPNVGIANTLTYTLHRTLLSHKSQVSHFECTRSVHGSLAKCLFEPASRLLHNQRITPIRLL